MENGLGSNQKSLGMVVSNCRLLFKTRKLDMDKGCGAPTTSMDGEDIQGHWRSVWSLAGNRAGDFSEESPKMGKIENQKATAEQSHKR